MLKANREKGKLRQRGVIHNAQFCNVSSDFEVINSNQADELGAKMSGKFIKLVEMSNESQAFKAINFGIHLVMLTGTPGV